MSVDKGVTVWLTGLSGAGKTTIAHHLCDLLEAQDLRARVLDGDVLRGGLCSDLGYSKEDRSENCRRAAEIARLLSASGIISIVALITPYEADRQRARQIHNDSGVPFTEVWVDTPAEVCEERDPKGLYARARRGELTEFTGVDDPFENPCDADMVVDTVSMTSLDGAKAILERIMRAAS